MLLGMVTNPRGRRKGDTSNELASERDAWTKVIRIALRMLEAIEGRITDAKRAKLDIAISDLDDLAHKMIEQLNSGVHVNGRHRVNGRGIKTSENVIAVVYRHLDDGQLYIHGFADADIKPITHRDGSLTVKGLVEDTDVEMYALPDGSVRLQGKHGQPLWEDIK